MWRASCRSARSSGSPNGYDTTAAKCFMAADAVDNGASEVDMVINLGWVKDQKWDALLAEIRAVKEACKGPPFEGHYRVLLSHRCGKKIKMCEIVTASGAEYIKTSTGFSTGGATQGGRGAFCQACRSAGEDQGGGRHRRFERRRGLYRAGRLPDWAPAVL